MGKEMKRNGLIRIIIILVLVFAVLWISKIYFLRTSGSRLITTQDKVDARKGRLNEFAWRLESFKKKNGRYPNDLTGISGISSGRWGGPTEYKVSEDGQSYALRDIGPDKVAGTADDIVWIGYIP